MDSFNQFFSSSLFTMSNGVIDTNAFTMKIVGEQVTPMSSPSFIVGTLICYLSTLAVIKTLMSGKDTKPVSFKNVFYIHNILLCTASTLMLILIGTIAYKDLSTNGLFHAICDESMGFNNHLNFLYYLNFLTKFWELGDTVFMALKKKDLPFLHVYHHSATFVLTWAQLAGRTAVQWVPIVFNLFVHVIMYYYYAETSRGKKFWWKKHLTTLQIIQFIVDLIFVGSALYFSLQTPSTCQMEPWAGWLGMGLLSSYLLLFIQFFIKTYSTKGSVKKTGATTATVGVVEGGKGVSSAGLHASPAMNTKEE